MFAFNSDAFAKAQSPLTQLSEYGKFQRGMPNSYSPNNDNKFIDATIMDSLESF